MGSNVSECQQMASQYTSKVTQWLWFSPKIPPLILFFVVVSISAVLLLTRIPLGMMEGFAEEYLLLGFNLAATGSFSGTDLPPAVFRPPGYSFMIACVIKVFALLLGKNSSNIDQGTVFNLIFGVQSGLLGLSAVILYSWLKRRLSVIIAFGAALLFGITPYLQIMTGFMHYEILHIVLVVTATSLLGICFEADDAKNTTILFCGAIFGLATLTRPMTLILPPFILLGCLLNNSIPVRLAIVKSGLVCAGMLLVILPYTARNYRLTGRIIPVNAQSGIAVWATTHKIFDRAPNRYRWWDVWYPDGNQIYSELTGETKYDLPVYMKNVLGIEDEFRLRALQNLIEQPSVYFSNLVRNAGTFLFDVNSVMLGIFIANQNQTHTPLKVVLDSRFVQQNPYVGSMTRLFDYTCKFLLVLSMGGLFVGLLRRDRFIIAPLVVLLCFLVAHSISYMDLLYYYIKLPFLFVFSAYFISFLTEMSGGGWQSCSKAWGAYLAVGISTALLVVQLAGVLWS